MMHVEQHQAAVDPPTMSLRATSPPAAIIYTHHTVRRKELGSLLMKITLKC